ncbi:copper chaperone PCu(A)C [Streptomyces doebereineriae]|uniref:Copper chaperone PCu(A)C n=1 Tax=Streptomyces doebereineriae TaxID=3075528 RepID=A0ABU2VJ79_9ACTN|nr:copper chaperone PCu(A)C [Streptomyces sp. DSM 41640]MDT0485645.1 copper chaperone PCu(A)C [Streptomyces sp. DSM 41640]
MTTTTEGSAPSWRSRTIGALRTAVLPVVACTATLSLLTVYTATGAAGDPPARINVSNGRIFVPLNSASTAAFFDIANTGAAADELESVSSPSLRVTMLGRNVSKNGIGRMEPIDSLPVPARSEVRMTPFTLDVMVLDPPQLSVGNKISVDLWFRKSGRITVEAVAVPAQW